jgi:hypothetical protein
MLPGTAFGTDDVSPALGFQGETGSLQDVDRRGGPLPPTRAQRAAVRALGAHATWNRFGTPRSLIKFNGYLATGLGPDAVPAARRFITANRALFRLSKAGVKNLELVSDVTLPHSSAHVVLFRQRFGELAAGQGGLVTVGVRGGRIAYASSSVSGEGSTPPAPAISAQDALSKAAAASGVTLGDIVSTRKDDDWTLFSVQGLAYPQRARLVALPTVTAGVRPAYEVIVLDTATARGPVATTSFVDAVTGKVWVRLSNVDYFTDAPAFGTFTGTTGQGGACGPLHDFEVPEGTKEIDVTAGANLPLNDIVLNLVYRKTGDVVASADTLTSPEAVRYAPVSGVPAGTYAAQVCPYDKTSAPFDYSGTYVTSPLGGGGLPFPPRWTIFPASPRLDYTSNDTRVTWCWDDIVEGAPVSGCDGVVKNGVARAPWDYDPRLGAPSFTTKGNGASSAEAWSAPLTPGPLGQQPLSPSRDYGFPWTNQWYESKCSPSVFTGPQRNDIDAAVTNLFAMHNRMHDFSYHLGFTEETYNLQQSNYGNTSQGPYPFGREGDPEIGDAQAGALTGGPPTFLGRDNANQITLNDGIPPITNMYLWQPLAGAFYPECVDGDYDMTVVGHEYTHAISNRMAGGPDAGLTGLQAGSMGESWSDLDALEYLMEYGLVPVGDENPWAVGAYVTGNKQRGIRDYPLNDNPLNYSDVGFDLTGPEVHADGEIWNAVNYRLRKELVEAYNDRFPASNEALQKRCADGRLPAGECPGNRRWVQIMYDAWLLMQPDVSMVDARDAHLAADKLQFGGANQRTLWEAFARTGLGDGAKTRSSDDDQPEASFSSPLASNATVDFSAVSASGKEVPARIYVGDYQARATPIADTDPNTDRKERARFVPGHYDYVVQAEGYGVARFSLDLSAGQKRHVTLRLSENAASAARGAKAAGSGVNHRALIDDEGTNWASLSSPVKGKQVTVRLAGGPRVVGYVQLSALLRPADAQNRFSALRSFEIQVCTASDANDQCGDGAGFKTIFVSPANAFPGVAPRPVAPYLTLRGFDVPDTKATHVRLVVLTNQCTGAPDFSGELDNDPANPTDCATSSEQADNVRAAELQVFGAKPDPLKSGGRR